MARLPPHFTLFPSRRSSDLLELLDEVCVKSGFKAQIAPRRTPGAAEEPTRRIDGVIERFAEHRSEEHTSNSSHVEISYAVFCLKKKSVYNWKMHRSLHLILF